MTFIGCEFVPKIPTLLPSDLRGAVNQLSLHFSSLVLSRIDFLRLLRVAKIAEAFVILLISVLVVRSLTMVLHSSADRSISMVFTKLRLLLLLREDDERRP